MSGLPTQACRRWITSKRAALACLLVAYLGGAAPTSAAELTLSGPARCSDADELRFRVERALGGALADAPVLKLDVTIVERERELSATLRVREGEGAVSERTLQAKDCAQLLEALSVVIVLAIARVQEESRTSSEPMRAASSEPMRAAPSEAARREPAADSEVSAVPEASAQRWQLGAGAWLTGDLGSLPEPALGAALGVSLDGTRLRLQASGVLFFEQRTDLAGPGVPRPGADVGLALGALSACHAPEGSWQSDGVLGVCARAELGYLFGRGANVRQERTGGRLWVAPGLSLVGAWRVLVPSLSVGVEAGAVLPLLRGEFRLGTLGELYRPAAVSARAGVGVLLVLE